MTDEQWGAGERAKWHDHGEVTVGKRRYPLVYGEHPHSRQDNRHYIDLGTDREPVGFDGHRVLIDVRITSENYMKESYYSGDQVRKGGGGEILADGVVVFAFFCRDPRASLLKAHRLIGELMEHPSGWMLKDERERLVGRKVFYREVPALVESLITDQGCLILTTENGEPFPAPVWREDDEREASVKVEVTDPNIWWFRE